MYCPFCNKDQPSESFESSSTPSGRAQKCNECLAKSGKIQRPLPGKPSNHPELPKNPWIEAKRRARQREDDRRRVKQQSRLRAWKIVETALKSGKLSKKLCQIGSKDCVQWPVEAHHVSYEIGKELDIIWVCKPCHDKLTAIRTRESRATRRK